MSATSTRRVKHQNGVTSAGLRPTTTALKASKTLTPISNPNSALKKSLSCKENPRSIPRVQKPSIRPVPRVDKAAAAAATATAGTGSDGRDGHRMRWSTSSAPTRGRSQSPSEFIRVFRDSRMGKGESDGNRAVSSAGKKNGGLVKKVGTCESSTENSHALSVLNGTSKKEVKLSSNLVKSSEFDSVHVSNLGSKGPNSVKRDKICVEKLESSGKDRVLIEEGKGNSVSGKYPSKLHEKLAFLEGKVKRIATDIKRTKEMLDMNNPDSSKLILSDIQDKISVIEKAMGQVGGDPSSKNGGVNKVGEKADSKKEDDLKGGPVKGLNGEDLEARLFPHHKLLRDRITLKASLGTSQYHVESNSVESSSELKAEKVLSPIEENPIAREFLASLTEEDTKVTKRVASAGSEAGEVQETDSAAASGKQGTSNAFNGKSKEDLLLTTDETLAEFDDQENGNTLLTGEEAEDTSAYQVNEIGSKSSTGGWFVSEGESVLLAHDDGSCSFYDIANCEEKAVYKPPIGVSSNIWRDCWIIRAPSADGCSGRYVVAASAGNTLDSGFCSWDFYDRDVRAFHIEDGGTTAQRTVLGPLPNNPTYRRNALSSLLLPETRQWWYKPCGPLIISATSSEKFVKVHDIRDGEQIMKWEVQKPVLAMDFSSPLQWRNRGKVVVAETETVSVWDVNSLNPHALLSISSSGRKISALHVINTDAELGGGVRQRVTSSEAEGNDGVFCTPDSINVLDFRHPSGLGLKIPKVGPSVESVFTRGGSVYIGCSNLRSTGRKHCSQVHQFSLRQQRLMSSYSLPESSAHSHNSAITQVWGNSNFVMAACGEGLFVFDALKEDVVESFSVGCDAIQEVKDIIGSNDLYSPSFDYLASRVLLISRDRPAIWKHIL